MLPEIGDKLPPGPPDGPEWYWGRVGGVLVGGQPGTLYGDIIRIRIVSILDILTTFTCMRGDTVGSFPTVY